MADHSFETLATGYGLIEGPCYEPASGDLFFSDVTNGGVYRLSADGTVTTAVPKRRGVGGIALHADGGLVLSGRNVCHVTFDAATGEPSTRVVHETDAGGLNDLFADGEGRVYVGTLRADPFGTDAERATGECLRLGPGGAAEVVYEDVSLSNGIGTSPDGRRLYHADTARQHVIVHDLDDDGPSGRAALTAGARFNPDGLAVDEAGVVWVADYGAGRVAGLNPDGGDVRSIAVPARAVTSLCFGGADGRDLYVVTADNDDPAKGGTVFRTRVEVPGLPLAPARV